MIPRTDQFLRAGQRSLPRVVATARRTLITESVYDHAALHGAVNNITCCIFEITVYTSSVTIFYQKNNYAATIIMINGRIDQSQ